jgi:gliding motility-associated-like protein
MIFDGVIKVDIPGSSFSNLYILLQQGEFLSSNEANTEFMRKLILGEGKALKQYSSVLRIYDKSEDRHYSFDNVTSELMDETNNFDLSTTTLHTLDAAFPTDFKYQEGDSVYLELNSRFDIEAFKNFKDELAYRQYVSFKYRTKSVLDNKPLGEESSFSICNCFEGVVTVAGFNLTAPVLSSLIFKEAGICDESTYYNLIFVMNIGHDLKSKNEIREVARPTGMRITKMPDFDFETLTVEYRSQFYTFEPTLINANEYFYDFEGVFPFAGTFSGNQYKLNIERRLKECLSKVTPTPFVYTIFFEKNDIGELYFPDSIVGTIQNFYTLPTLALELNQKNITAFTNKVGFAMRISEQTNFKFDVDDLFIRVTTTSGLKNVRIYDPLTGANFDLNNGIYYLGNLETAKIKNVEFIADSESCGEEKIFIEYGYDCGVFSDIASSPCFLRRDSVIVTFPGSVVDLQPETTDSDISLCTEITNTVYVYNAGLGTAFDMNVGMTLPTGMTLIPGSCRLIYPSGGTQSFAIPDPLLMNGNNFSWILNDIWPVHKLSGLNGTAFSPNNGFDIEFKTTTNCDFISGTTIIYNTDANQICNIPTNKVAKVSNSFNINGVLPPYTLNVLSEYMKPPNCKNDSLQISFSFNKPLANEGKIYVDVPQGWTFVPNSASGNLNNIVPAQQNSKLVWDINSTFPNIDMTFWLQKTENAICQPTFINIYTTLSASAFCTSSMEECDIETITGSSILNIPQENPVFEINNFQVEMDASLDARVTITISNISDNISNDVIGKVYLDQDGNGMLSAGDQLLSDVIFSGFDDMNKTITQIVTLNGIGNADFCSLLFVLAKTDNCICEDLISTIKLPSRVIIKPKVICSGDALNIGVTSTPNVVYQWNMAEGLSCTQCANASFSVVNNTPNPITFKRILITTNSNGCQTLYEYDITIQPKPTVLSQNLSICVGDTLTAIATLGTSYIWDGPNIIENGNQLLLANPSISTSYSVTITDQNGCSGSGTFAVNVRNKPSVEVVYDSLFCYGPSPELSLVLEPNTTFRWANAGGVLSDINSTNPTILTQQDITLQLEVRNQNCVTNVDVLIKFYEAFMVTGVEDTLGICMGEKVNINLAGGQTYNISPSNFVECLNPSCSNISIDAMFDQQTFLITAQDLDMCISERLFTINTFTDTIRMSEQLSICEGESIVIFDENVTIEGTYCDTIKVANSVCVTVMCKTLTVRPGARQDQAVDICAGDTYIFNGQSITQAGQYCNNFTSVNGCDSISCVTVSLNSLPDLTNLDIEYSVKSGDTISLIAPNGFSSYRWSPSIGLSCDDCPSPLAFPQEDIIYTLEVTNEDGCIATRTVRTIVTPSCIKDIPTIPNAFTPNNDGINDFYTLGDIDLCGPMIFTVYNRWGNQVYQMVDWDNNWDGNSNNLGELPQGTYYISIEFVSEGVTRVGFVDLRKK